MTYAGGKKEWVKESLPEASEESPAGRPFFDGNDRRPLALEFDYEEYAHFLSQYDLTEDEKRAHLEALWRILIAFADLGFGIHPAQAACGQAEKKSPESSLAALFAVECEDIKHCEKYAGAPDNGVAAEESES